MGAEFIDLFIYLFVQTGWEGGGPQKFSCLFYF